MPHLSVQEAVEEGGKEALERDQEGGEVAPDAKVEDALVVGSCHHLDAVGDPQQWLQDNGCSDGLPVDNGNS